ncbi:MAG: hypothetical protein CL910_17990 [Deltaproteobacteria bacterium]|nr:hypothetical protein [Deltaproteobacteria bacterium]
MKSSYRQTTVTLPAGQKIHGQLQEVFGAELVELVDAIDPYTVIKDATKFLMIMGHLKSDPDLAFDFLRSVSGVDYPDEEEGPGHIASVYHLYSYKHRHAHVVKYMCDREAPEVPSVEKLWPTANWYEREAYDLLGIVYLGHRNRKDFAVIGPLAKMTDHPIRETSGDLLLVTGVVTLWKGDPQFQVDTVTWKRVTGK